jgi:hypothetical protein
MVVVELQCPNSERVLKRKVLVNGDEKKLLINDWIYFLEAFQSCSHPLKGKTLWVASLGTNPFIFTDYNRNPILNERGHPAGGNTGIVESLGRAFGFEVNITIYKNYDFYDKTASRWIGMTEDVSCSN